MSEPRTEHQDDPHPLASLECAELAVWMNGFTTTKPVFFENQVRVAFAALQARHAEEVAAKDKQIELDHRSKVELFRENATLRDQLAAVQQERDDKAAMHSELATLAGSAIVLATLDTLAGERPTQEPEHALPAAVWRLVQERDEARAANTANLREMVGMAGRFRQTLQTVRACIVALTPGHRTGYDWNADPLYLTRKEGEALSAIVAALSSPSTQEPNKETKMSSEPEIARCGLCGEPMPAGEEMFNYHGYSGPCPTPAPKPPQKATCETHGHIYGHEGVCLF